MVGISIVTVRYKPVSDDTGHKLWYRPVSVGPHTGKPSDRYVSPISGKTGRFSIRRLIMCITNKELVCRIIRAGSRLTAAL
ncbi:hypothetical protein GW17_00002236 [Ensete ventricosum]|nr:hypothetical protein GW17_00002236 [Ensete ventricosum]RZS21277.1 hypothetical protein BHM03_00053900 [Ensete ventricosum]